MCNQREKLAMDMSKTQIPNTVLLKTKDNDVAMHACAWPCSVPPESQLHSTHVPPLTHPLAFEQQVEHFKHNSPDSTREQCC